MACAYNNLHLKKIIFPSMSIPIIKKVWLGDHLVMIMGIPILVRQCIILKLTQPPPPLYNGADLGSLWPLCRGYQSRVQAIDFYVSSAKTNGFHCLYQIIQD